MKTIYSQNVNGFSVTATDAGEGQVFGNFFAAANGEKVRGGRYLVVWDYADRSGQGKQYFDSYVHALQFAMFQRNQLRFCQAKDAGLNDDTAELVATGKMTLAEALGDTDVDAEVDYMEKADYVNECEDDPEDDGFDPDLHGGEDDDTPPLEVIMAGGWAAWEWQNEKNARADGHW